MKTLVLCALLGAAALSLTGCETTVVEHRHGYYDHGYYDRGYYGRPAYRSGYYADRSYYRDGYYDPDYRSSRTVVVGSSPAYRRNVYVGSTSSRTYVGARTAGGTVVVTDSSRKRHHHDHDRDHD